MTARDIVMSAAGASAPVATDPNFENVTLLLNGDGTNGAQNNTFLDSSTNNFTITRNGNTTQGTFSPYGNLWSNYFDGDGNYLTTPYNSGFDLPADFSIETMFYAIDAGRSADSTKFGILLGVGTAGSVSNYYNLGLLISGSVISNFSFDVNGTYILNPTGLSISLNAWHHIVVCRSGNTISMFVDGTRVATTTYTTSIAVGGTLNIARNFYGAPYQSWTKGYISNARIIKGSQPYNAASSTITVPTTPLTAISGTSLLTCQSNRFINNSSNNFTLTVNGNTSVQRFSPFNPTAAYSASTIGGSGYFDRNGDYLTTPNVEALRLGSGDFTVEAWINPNIVTAANFSGVVGTYAYNYAGDGDRGWFFGLDGTGKPRFFMFGASGAIEDFIAPSVISPNTWTHIAAVRRSGTLNLYVNGVSVVSAASSKNEDYSLCPLQVATVYVAQFGGFGSANTSFSGNISNIRIVKGTAVYTGNFTPPTLAPLAATGAASAACYPSTTNVNTSFTNTSLLLNFTNAGVWDAAMMNDLETVGNARVSTSVKKYGTGSLAFDGSGDWLYSLITPFNTRAAFTIESWCYISSRTNFILMAGSTTTSAGDALYLQEVGGTVYFGDPAVNTITFSSSLMPLNQWFHCACTFDGTTYRVFINGSSVGSSTTLLTNNTLISMQIGARTVGTQTANLNGYLDDFRITKGLARYPTEPFPTAALPTY